MRNAEQDQSAYNWLTVAEVALKVRVSAAQVRRWIASGQLTAMDIADDPDRKGHRPTWRVDPASVAALVRRRTRTAGAAA